ncbi:peptide-methionine (S)-S-oxide reductase MsrA [Natronorubrum texcoconense]|uniref:Peptide methionine sulfoxide reductase MsrA n=1 Tax=Natronorubrum texcoconense TaxID=1095776 RepID=A0A1G8VBY5_9EURY|nr:peptide-methionine (S)-S-oxide reductase MsrA [Natronorubrum texcoconense]SDJ63578.1 peptide-methionine (S)-S-oxide reductase [Natronorubrum texcoconense]
MNHSSADATTAPASEQDARTPTADETRTATLGMGCFWGPDARFGAIEGVVRTRVGYAGGTSPTPSYHSLGDHTEVVQVEYDPDTLGYDDLLEVYWTNHDWGSTAPKRQYRSVVLAADDDQLAAAERSRDVLEERTGRSVATDLERLEAFTRAEDYHQKYELRSTPVVGDELATRYGDAFVDSTVVARLNGFVAGHGEPSQRAALFERVELEPTQRSELQRRF